VLSASNFNPLATIATADLLVLKTILHDWSDEKRAMILKRCREAMQIDSRQLIVDRVKDEPIDVTSALYVLHMLVQIGSREHTAVEFNNLLE
jgi:hypothetical protein